MNKARKTVPLPAKKSCSIIRTFPSHAPQQVLCCTYNTNFYPKRHLLKRQSFSHLILVIHNFSLGFLFLFLPLLSLLTPLRGAGSLGSSNSPRGGRLLFIGLLFRLLAIVWESTNREHLTEEKTLPVSPLNLPCNNNSSPFTPPITYHPPPSHSLSLPQPSPPNHPYTLSIDLITPFLTP